MSTARNSAHFSVQFSDGLCHHPLCRVDWQLLTFAYCNMAVAAAGDATVPMLYGVLIDAIAIDQDVQKFQMYMVHAMRNSLRSPARNSARNSLTRRATSSRGS